MHTAERRKYPFEFPRRSPQWTEIAASGIATVALFLTALVSMTSVADTERSRSQLDDSRTQTRVTFFPPPAPLPPAPRPREKPAAPRPTPTQPTPRAAEPVSPVVPTAPPRTDTATVPTIPTAPPTNVIKPDDRVEFRPNAGGSGLGAPAAPAGLTEKSRARGASTMTARDSSLAAWAAAAHEAQRWSTMSDAMKKSIAESKQDGVKLAQRVGTAGNSGDIHVVQGQGKDGVGAAGGPGTLGSIGLPLFSRGKSREQRMRDSVIDAEIRAGLARSAAIIKARRDSIRADSILTDSLRKLAQVRKP